MGSKEIKAVIIARDGLRCSRTGKNVESPDELEIEHIVPKSSGGTDEINNLILVSRPVNSEFSNRAIGSVAGAAILGASLAGPVGMIIGGVLGALLGKSIGEGKRNG